MRIDPTDTGGLFTGRRPGTRPIRYRALPERGTQRRQRIDATLAGALLVFMVLVNLLFWGPLPVAGLWLGAHVQYWTGDVSAGILVAFVFLLFALLLVLMALKRLDRAWILVRRAAGHDQREGMLSRVFVVTCALGTAAFSVWFLAFSGAELAPLGIQF